MTLYARRNGRRFGYVAPSPGGIAPEDLLDEDGNQILDETGATIQDES